MCDEDEAVVGDESIWWDDPFDFFLVLRSTASDKEARSKSSNKLPPHHGIPHRSGNSSIQYGCFFFIKQRRWVTVRRGVSRPACSKRDPASFFFRAIRTPLFRGTNVVVPAARLGRVSQTHFSYVLLWVSDGKIFHLLLILCHSHVNRRGTLRHKHLVFGSYHCSLCRKRLIVSKFRCSFLETIDFRVIF